MGSIIGYILLFIMLAFTLFNIYATATKKKRDQANEKKYNALMTAKMLTIADTDIENTRKKVNKLIRTVNQCITLLSEKQ